MASVSMAAREAYRNCDASLGPTADSCGSDSRFDFTLTFEQSVLSITPYVILLSIAIPRVYHLWKSSRKVRGRSMHVFKLATCIVFATLQLTLLISWAVNHGPVATKLGIASSAIGFVTAVVMCALSWLEHERSVRPSTLLCVYLLISLLFDIAQCRTLWLLNKQPGQPLQALPSLFTALMACRAVMLLSESLGKTRYLLGPWQRLKACPEALASVFSRGTFWWLNELLTRGFSSTLQLDTLHEPDEKLYSDKLLGEFQQGMATTKPSKYRLLLVICKTIKGTIIKSAIARLLLIGLRFSQPFLLQYIIEFVENDQKGDDYHQDIAYSLVGATALLYIVTALCDGFYKHHLYRGVTMIRGGLVALVCSHSLGVSTATAAEMSILTLIGPDINVINGAFTGMHNIWANPIEIVLATWLLARQLGVGCLGPIASALLCFVMMSQLPKRMGPAIKAWNEAIQTRVSITSSVVGSIRETKMLGLVPVWLDYIQSLRTLELKESKKFRLFITIMNILGNLSPCLAPILTFGIALGLKGGASFSISTTFTSLSIIGLIMEPLADLLFSFPNFMSSFGIFERVENFLEQAKYGDSVYSRSTSSEATSTNAANTDTANADTVRSSIELSRIHTNSVNLRSASFTAKAGQDAILHDITLRIQPGEVHAVTGKVGSGKSLLMLAVLGELGLVDGSRDIDVERFGYCAQSAWLFKGTIRDNIVGWTAGEFDEVHYNRCVRACGLDKDFEQLKDGDLTMLSSKGLSLSGGQRHRVALARALFARTPVFVVDDIFSSLDKKTQKLVWDNVFGPNGIVRELGSSAIIATHSLQIIQQADNVIVMEKCRVARQGAYSSIADEESLQQAKLSADSEPALAAVVEDAADKETNAAAKKEEEVNQAIDDLMRSQGDSSLYWYYLKSIGWRYGLIGLSLSVSMEVFTILHQIWLKFWTESNVSGGSGQDGMYYGVYTLFQTLVIIFIGMDCWFMFVKIIPKSAGKLHWSLLKTVMRAPMYFFGATSIGDLVNRFSQDMSLVDRDLPTAVYTSVKGALSVVGGAILVLFGSKYLAAAIPLVAALLYAVQKFYLRTSRQMRLLQLQASSPLYAHLVESGEGLATVRAFRWEAPVQRHAVALLDRSQRPHYLLYAIQRWLTFVLDVTVGGLAVVLVVLAVVVRQTGTGSVAVAMSNVLGFGRILADFITSWTQLETSLGAISRLKAFEETTPQEAQRLGTCEPPASWPSQGLLEIRNLSASYKTEPASSPTTSDADVTSAAAVAAADDQDAVLRQVSATIQPGQRVAVCGRTGSGKSSLLLTLYQLLRHSGTTLLDGVDISLVPQDTLRSRLITVPQEPIIFPGTIRFNLCPGASSSSSSSSAVEDAVLLSALDKVALSSAVLALPAGLDADVTDAALSHGQKQLLCLARALVRKETGRAGRVLVLDEATSSVDDETEERMVRVVEDEFAGYTVLAVAHRLESVRGFDRVWVLDKGKLVKTGTPNELIGEDGQLRL